MAINSLPKSEYVDAVLNLIELTQKGKLNWRPVKLDFERISELGFASEQYEADFQDVTLRLTFASPRLAPQKSRMTDAEAFVHVLAAPTGVLLQAIKPNGEVVVDFPDIPPLRGLHQAIRLKDNHEEVALLKAINEAVSAVNGSK